MKSSFKYTLGDCFMYAIRTFIAGSLLAAALSTAFATPLPKEEKEGFVKSFVPSCLTKQRKSPLSKYMTESQLHEYCYCAANRATDFISVEDFGRMIQTKDMEPMRSSVEAAGNYCIQVLSKKWGYSK